MKLTILFILLCLSVTLTAQNSYIEAIQQGDAAFKKGEYKTAINKYFAAEAFDPSKKEIVKAKVSIVFDKIEDLRREAEKARQSALIEKEKAEKAERAALISDSLTNVTLDSLQRLNSKVNAIANQKDSISINSTFQEQISYAKQLIASRELKKAKQVLDESMRNFSAIHDLKDFSHLQFELEDERRKCDSLLSIQKKFNQWISEGDSLNNLGICCKTAAYQKYKDALNLNFSNEFAEAGLYKIYISVESKLLSNRFDKGVENPNWISSELSLIEADTQLAVKKLIDLEKNYYSFYPHGTNNRFLKEAIEKIGLTSHNQEVSFFFNPFVIIMDKAFWETPKVTNKFSGAPAIEYGLSYSLRSGNSKFEFELSTIKQEKSWGDVSDLSWLETHITEGHKSVFSGYNMWKLSSNIKVQTINSFYPQKTPFSLYAGVGLIYYELSEINRDSAFLDINEYEFKNDGIMASFILEGKIRLSKKRPLYLSLESQYATIINSPAMHQVLNYSQTPPFDFSIQKVSYFFRHLSNRLGVSIAF